MRAFDLPAIGSVAPTLDLQAGLVLMGVAAVIAHGAVLPPLHARNQRAALALSLAFLLGAGLLVATLQAAPQRFYAASLAYVVAFLLGATFAARNAADTFVLRRRILLGAALMAASVAIAWWLAFAPR